MREWIRADEKRKAEKQFEAKLLEGMNSAESELTPADWSALRKDTGAGGSPKRNSADAEGYQRAAARRDLVERFVYLAENAGLDTAERFLRYAEASFNDLAGHLTPGHPDLAGMRKWRVKDFDDHLIF